MSAIVCVIVIDSLCGVYSMYYHFRPENQSCYEQFAWTKDRDDLFTNNVDNGQQWIAN